MIVFFLLKKLNHLSRWKENKSAYCSISFDLSSIKTDSDFMQRIALADFFSFCFHPFESNLDTYTFQSFKLSGLFHPIKIINGVELNLFYKFQRKTHHRPSNRDLFFIYFFFWSIAHHWMGQLVFGFWFLCYKKNEQIFIIREYFQRANQNFMTNDCNDDNQHGKTRMRLKTLYGQWPPSFISLSFFSFQYSLAFQFNLIIVNRIWLVLCKEKKFPVSFFSRTIVLKFFQNDWAIFVQSWSCWWT